MAVPMTTTRIIKALVVLLIAGAAAASLLSGDWPLHNALVPAATERIEPSQPPLARPLLRLVEQRPRWTAAAPGRVEPQSGEFHVGSSIIGRIAEVLVRPDDRVATGDLLVRLDDSELLARVAATAAEVTASRHERDRQSSNGDAKKRRKAEDAVWEAEQRLAGARDALDRSGAGRPTGQAGEDDVAAARSTVMDTAGQVGRERDALAAINQDPDTPQPTAPDLALAVARAQLAVAQAALEHTRIRAPVAGTVLQVTAKAGETAALAADATLVVIGDLSGLRVRAEVDERDLGKVKVGQRVTIRADAFPDQTFDGRVSAVAPSLAPARLLARGQRRPSDAEVLEVVVDLDGPTPLLSGLRVDVFFFSDTASIAGERTLLR
jgi:HlyD family secretion protein